MSHQPEQLFVLAGDSNGAHLCKECMIDGKQYAGYELEFDDAGVPTFFIEDPIAMPHPIIEVNEPSKCEWCECSNRVAGIPVIDVYGLDAEPLQPATA